MHPTTKPVPHDAHVTMLSTLAMEPFGRWGCEPKYTRTHPAKPPAATTADLPFDPAVILLPSATVMEAAVAITVETAVALRPEEESAA